MAHTASPESFVRMYDGAENPIGKSYTRPELRRAFAKFRRISFKRYFLPYSKPVVALPVHARRLLSKAGLMILVTACK